MKTTNADLVRCFLAQLAELETKGRARGGIARHRSRLLRDLSPNSGSSYSWSPAILNPRRRGSIGPGEPGPS